MKRIVTLLALLMAVCSYSQELRTAYIGDLELVSGRVITDCRVSYTTAGILNENESNVIVYPTWFGGRSESIINVGARLFDTTKYFLIAIDALGNGLSSSPSNSPHQPNNEFPEISIKDMVNAQYRLLKNEIGIKKVYAFIGGSMGGMQVFEWAVSYPDFMNKVIIYAGSPRLTPFDLMLWTSEILVIENWISNGGSEEELADIVATIHNLLITTPRNKNRQVSRENFDQYLNNTYIDFRKTFNPYDWKSQLIAMTRHDISINGSIDEAALRIKADMLIMVGAQDLIVNPDPAIEFAEKFGYKKYIFDNDCGHLAPGCEFETFKSLINSFIDDKPLN
jgi:homoserine O-acetyltransferase/O-succinyltransferase